ncbi:MAG: hypothetical protein ACREPY_06020 [Rhodanobacteraceae bacterium]
MKSLVAIAIGCLVLAGCASVRPGLNQRNHYGVVMSSQLPQAKYMTLRFDGKKICTGDIAKDKPIKCNAVAYTPSHVRVTWRTPSNQSAENGNHLVVRISWFYQLPPRWFRTGDVMHFTITRFHRLSVVFVCHRPGDACVNYPPVTAYGQPIGYDLGYAISKPQ